MIATFDLPSRIRRINDLLSQTRRFTTTTLIYDHTLFPLYAPFIPEHRRKLALKRMLKNTNGTVHLMLGVAASRTKAAQQLRYCKICSRKQFLELGESFWRRDWFLPSLPYCHLHGELTIVEITKGSRRHEFIPLLFDQEIREVIEEPDCKLRSLAEKALGLLQLPEMCSPSLDQWSRFYRDIARENGLTKGRFLKIGEIGETVKAAFGTKTLQLIGLCPSTDQQSNWITAMFRKQRKAFSYLEHLIVWSSFLPSASVGEVLTRVGTSIKVHPLQLHSKLTVTDKSSSDSINRTCRRDRWTMLVGEFGVKKARSNMTGGSDYAWLYRHDRKWLIDFNSAHKDQTPRKNTRVDWKSRDLRTVKRLVKVKREWRPQAMTTRKSANWYLNQLPSQKDTIYKNLDKLPLTNKFLIKYAETISQYQIRRLSKVCIEKICDDLPIKTWEILREAGLTESRMTQDTRLYAGKLKLEL